MKRIEYNENILDRCTELLRSHDASKVYQGVILSAYLIEQAFKSELRRINPLLYFSRKNITDEIEALIAMKRLSEEEIARLKTSTARRSIVQICKCKNDLRPHKANFEELFEIRNFLLHSTDDLSFDENSVSETAVSALRACREYVVKYSGISSGEFDPLTSVEFEKLQEKKRNKRLDDLKTTLKEHKKIFEQLEQSEVQQRVEAVFPETDPTIWIEETFECPACGNLSLDEIGSVDFEWDDGLLSTYGGYRYQCRVCELELSGYEYNLIS